MIFMVILIPTVVSLCKICTINFSVVSVSDALFFVFFPIHVHVLHHDLGKTGGIFSVLVWDYLGHLFFLLLLGFCSVAHFFFRFWTPLLFFHGELISGRFCKVSLGCLGLLVDSM